MFSPLPDRIFASTLACAAAAAGGRVELTGCSPELYAPVLEILAQMGCRVERGGESVQVARFGRLYGAGRVFTGVYRPWPPEPPRRWRPAMLCAEGESSIEDVIFERRFACGGLCGFGRAGKYGGPGAAHPAGWCTAGHTPFRTRPAGRGQRWMLAAMAAQGRSKSAGLRISTVDMRILQRFWPLLEHEFIEKRSPRDPR